MMTTLFNLSFSVYLLAVIVAVVATFARNRLSSIVSVMLMAAGALVHAAYIALRWHEAGRAPSSNMFESLVLFAWAVMVVYLALRIRFNVPAMGAASAFLALLVLAYAGTFESDIKPLMPALRSNWLSVHVFMCLLGYAGFAISFLAAVGYLFSCRARSCVSETTRELVEVIVAKTIASGFLFLTVGIITGSVWANSAWGSYWSWDPKETWSLVTWLVYALYLHCRYVRGWRGRRAAWISIIGFACVLFTYFGVNFLLVGRHSYA